MSTCAWCGELATTNVEVAPAQTRVRRGVKEIVKAPLIVAVCPDHRAATNRRTTPRPPIRRKPGPDQVTIFDALTDR